MVKRFGLSLLVPILALAASAQAGVISHSDINGLGTFEDTNTGRVWLGLGAFAGTGSYNDLRNSATLAGFTVASITDVQGLLNSLSLDPNADPSPWAGYAAIMQSPSQGIIWGAFLPAGEAVGWAFAFPSDSNWSYNDGNNPSAPTQSLDAPLSSDAGIWAYQEPVPEPSYSLLLAGLGAVMLTVRRLRA